MSLIIIIITDCAIKNWKRAKEIYNPSTVKKQSVYIPNTSALLNRILRPHSRRKEICKRSDISVKGSGKNSSAMDLHHALLDIT